MKLHSLLCGSALLLGSFSALAAYQLDVNIHQIKTTAGTLHVALYNNEAHYEAGEKALAVQKVAVSSNKIQLQFAGLAAGNYAIKVMHDENNNGELDRNLFGIPSEGYGFSNNGGQFGPASFSEATFAVQADQQIAIQLH
ncbi:DUF2141 domain-containing protein [Rheinheimera sp.]|uniref:DUF2141 domain-containing protein n=1 Tax=Rheinheimera sp. TaxID=1869214 RepID=UPI0027B8CA29|nr:DUF2141 domain-containing protein [Rheinheimera sp.]